MASDVALPVALALFPAIALLVWVGSRTWLTARFIGLAATSGSLGTVLAFPLWRWIDFGVILAGAELDSVVERQTGRHDGGSPDGGTRPGG